MNLKLHTTTAAGALCASMLILSACGGADEIESAQSNQGLGAVVETTRFDGTLNCFSLPPPPPPFPQMTIELCLGSKGIGHTTVDRGGNEHLIFNGERYLRVTINGVVTQDEVAKVHQIIHADEDGIFTAHNDICVDGGLGVRAWQQIANGRFVFNEVEYFSDCAE